ncbi:J domain-containing protein [Rubrobacter indicoceani]|uniref:J domain-containing protein n=1 Tax=Rubrobacter indicoceani TaxID=2051957 RepID=UPI000E5BEB51|nr:DnaJ domain-containing protein [Rubrobacter indicoceani]
MASQVNYYDVLGVRRNASRDEIRTAYRNLAKERHPDNPGGSAEAFSLLQEAHDTLSDPNRRKQHDQDLDLAFAATQLSDLDFSSLDDELAARRRQRGRRSSDDFDEGGSSGEGGPGLGERLRERFGRSRERAEQASSSRSSRSERGGGRGGGRRGRYEEPTAKWYEPQDFDPEPVTLQSGARAFIVAFLVFIVVGQLGIWANVPQTAGALSGISALAPFMTPVYVLAGLVVTYFAYKSAGYWAVALTFLAALVVGGSGGPEGLLQFISVGVLAFLAVIYFGNRRDARSRQR